MYRKKTPLTIAGCLLLFALLLQACGGEPKQDAEPSAAMKQFLALETLVNSRIAALKPQFESPRDSSYYGYDFNEERGTWRKIMTAQQGCSPATMIVKKVVLFTRNDHTEAYEEDIYRGGTAYTVDDPETNKVEMDTTCETLRIRYDFQTRGFAVTHIAPETPGEAIVGEAPSKKLGIQQADALLATWNLKRIDRVEDWVAE